MKTFLRKIIVVIFSVVIIFIVFNAVYYKTAKRTRLTAFEIYDAIEKTSQKTEYTALVLGDSVARQIFNPEAQEESEEVCYLATNQAIMPAGNYILLENYLQNNPQTETVYYIARPDSMQGGINFIYTYSYFVTPLYTEPFRQYLAEETSDGIEKVFGTFPASYEFPKWLIGKYPKLLELYNDGAGKLWMARNRIHAQEMPDMSITYIAEMRQACMKNNVEFVLLSPPLPEGFDPNSIERMKAKMADAGMAELMDGFEESICYIDQEEFVDGIHMTGEFLDRNRERLIHDLIEIGA